MGASLRLQLAWSAARQVVMRLGTLVAFIVAANVLPKSELGLFAVSVAVAAIADIFAEGGMGDAAIQSREQNEAVLLAATWLNVLIALIASASLIAGRSMIEQALNTPGLAAVLPFLCVSLVLNAIAYVPQALLRRDMAFRPLATVSMYAVGCSSVVGISLLFAGCGVWSLVIQNILAAGITTILIWARSPYRLRWSDPRRARSLLPFGLGVILTKVCAYLATRSIEILLPLLFGPAALATYIMGSRITAVASQFTSAVATEVNYVNLAQIGRDNREMLLGTLYGSVRVSAALIMPVFFGVASIAPEIMGLLYGANGSGSTGILFLTAVLGGLQAITYQNYLAIQIAGRPHLVGFLLLIAGLLGMLAALLNSRSLEHAVVAFALAQATLLPMSTIACSRLVGSSGLRTARIVLPFLIGCTVMLGVSFPLRSLVAPITYGSDLLGLVVLVPMLGLLYAACVSILDFRATRAVVKAVLSREAPIKIAADAAS